MPNSPNTKNFDPHAMLLLAVYFACGVVFGHAGWLGLTGAAIAAIVLLVSSVIKRSAAGAIIPLIFVPLGTVCYEIETLGVTADRVKRIYAENRIASYEPVEIEGVLVGPPEPSYGGSFLTVRVDRLTYKDGGQPVQGRVRLFASTEDDVREAELLELDLSYGSRIRVACRLERDERFLNPGVASRPEMLDQQGIDAVATIKSPLLIQKLGEESVFRPLAWAYEERQRLIDAFRDTFSARTAGILTASLLGDKHFLDRHTAATFREGGTFHVLVISGLHITFIGGVTLWAVSLITRRVFLQAVLASVFLWGYTLAVGGGVPVVRATVMFSFLLLSRVIYRESSLVNALGTCTLLLLVLRPSDLFTASFQLTVASVAAIVGCAFPLIEKLRAIGGWMPTREAPLPPNVSNSLRRVCEFLYWNESAWRIENDRHIWSANLFKSPYPKRLRAPNMQSVAAYVCEGAMVSLIVQVWMLPLLVIYFHRVSVPAVVLNLWVGVFLALESFAALGAVVTSVVSEWLAAPMIVFTELLNRMMMLLPSVLSSAGVADVRLPVYAGSGRAVYYLFAGSVVLCTVQLFKWQPFRLERPVRRGRAMIATAVVTMLLGAAILFHPFSAPRGDGLLRIDFLDVGQGDAALITFPNGETMLVDGGGRADFREDEGFEPDVPRIGEAVVSEFLWEKGYSRVDYLLATHADADHMQGLIDVAANFDVGSIIVGHVPESDREFDELMALAGKKTIPVVSVAEGYRWDIGGVELVTLNPPRRDVGSRAASANNDSIVILLRSGHRTFLLTGDIERAAEEALLASGEPHLAADLVKVPHHGSRTSSTEEFVSRVGAGTAVISVGRRSRFGHPHPDVVRRWRDARAEVVTTGERGTITVETNGDLIRIATFRP
jgi:competence protein ComEC